MRKFAARQIPLWLYVAALAALCAARLLIAHSQRVYLLPEGSGIDDMLMIRAGMNVAEGNWLGAYGGMAMAKNMGFALWLALLHTLGVPVLPGNAALWLLACGFAVWCLRPVFAGRLARLVLFAFLAFQPVSFAFFTQRVYRDAIFPALCLAFFAGVLGLGLRLASVRVRGALACALGAGLGLAGAWLTREDGAVLGAFAVCALAAILLFAVFSKAARRRAAKAVCALLPFVVLGAGILGFSAANYGHYGVFMVNDLNSGSFAGAYGAMAAVSAAESGHTPQTPVTRAALEKMYAEVPSLVLLREQLESGPVLNGFGDKETEEYGGSFYFALRLAAEYAGVTPTAGAAQDYWATVYAEIGQAVAEGRLQSEAVKATTVPRYDGSLLGPTLAETGRGMWTALTFKDCDPRPAESVGTPEEIARVAAWLHSPVQQGYVAGTSEPYYNAVQKICFTFCDIITWSYRVLIGPLLALGIFGMVRAIVLGIKALGQKRGLTLALLWGILLLGLLLSFAARAVVAAYMEVAAFGVGTAILYLSPALPPLLLFCGAGSMLWPYEDEPETE